MSRTIANVRLQWRTPDEGGRKVPFTGTVYAPTARFVSDDREEEFSVVLCLADPNRVQLELLAPENLPEVEERLRPGESLVLKEGGRVVADCTILSVEEEEPATDGKGPLAAGRSSP
jgi:hypothetical protein